MKFISMAFSLSIVLSFSGTGFQDAG